MQPLGLLVFFVAIGCIICSAIMYYVEQGVDATVCGTEVREMTGDDNPQRTIMSSMWWAIVTMTTVGYGDVVPVRPMGQFVAALTMIIGILIIALPVAIVGNKFQEIQDRDEKSHNANKFHKHFLQQLTKGILGQMKDSEKHSNIAVEENKNLIMNNAKDVQDEMMVNENWDPEEFNQEHVFGAEMKSKIDRAIGHLDLAKVTSQEHFRIMILLVRKEIMETCYKEITLSLYKTNCEQRKLSEMTEHFYKHLMTNWTKFNLKQATVHKPPDSDHIDKPRLSFDYYGAWGLRDVLSTKKKTLNINEIIHKKRIMLLNKEKEKKNMPDKRKSINKSNSGDYSDQSRIDDDNFINDEIDKHNINND